MFMKNYLSGLQREFKGLRGGVSNPLYGSVTHTMFILVSETNLNIELNSLQTKNYAHKFKKNSFKKL